MKTYRPYQPRQGFLLTPSPLDWLPEEHLSRFVLETVQELDLTAITAHYQRESRGYPPHDPRMMVALLLYACCVGVPSSRQIERKTHEDIAFRVLAGNTHPDHSCISDFRRLHLPALGARRLSRLRVFDSVLYTGTRSVGPKPSHARKLNESCSLQAMPLSEPRPSKYPISKMRKYSRGGIAPRRSGRSHAGQQALPTSGRTAGPVPAAALQPGAQLVVCVP